MEPLETLEPEGQTSISSTIEQYERAQIDIQIATAKKYPREDLRGIQLKLMAAVTVNEETAGACFYSLRRKSKEGGEKLIRGPSIRMAELAISFYGNLKFGARIIENDGKTITAQGVCHDLQRNIVASLEVKRRITDKYGRTFNEDMQVVTGNAACAIAIRNAALKVIPGALVNPVYEQALKVAVGDAKTLASRRQIAIEKFAKFGVSQERILKVLDHTSIEEITLDDLEFLTGLRNEIRDEIKTIEEAFPVETPAPKPSFAHRHQAKEQPPPTPPVDNDHVESGSSLFTSSTAPSERPPTPAASATSATGSERGTVVGPESVPGSAAISTDNDSPTLPMDGPAAVIELERLMAQSDVTEEEIMAYCQANPSVKGGANIATKKQRHLRELSTTKLLDLILKFEGIAQTIKAPAP